MAAPLLDDVAKLRGRFLEAMDDDFNTGGATGDLFELVRRLNKFVDDEKLEASPKGKDAQIAALRQGVKTLRELAGALGLFRNPPVEQSAGDDELTGKLLDLFIEVRADARKNKDFAMADKIRDRLGELGVTLEDRARWHRMVDRIGILNEHGTNRV